MRRARPHIVRVHRDLDPRSGGIVSSLLATTAALADRCSVTIVTRDDQTAHHAPFIQAGAEVRVTHRRQPNMPDTPIDLVTVEGPWNPESPYIAVWCRRHKVPYVYVPHGSLSDLVRAQFAAKHIKKLAYWMAVERWVAAGAAGVWYASVEEQQRSAHTFPWMPQRSTTLPFTSRDLMSHTRRVTSDEPLRLVTAARITPVKDLDVLISALAATDRGWRVDVAGQQEREHAQALSDLASRLGVRDRITMHGFLASEELDSLLAASHVYVTPGLESFGMAVAEALSANLPVVASDAVALSPLLSSSGAIFQRGDVAGLVQSISDLEDRLRTDGFDRRPREVWEHNLSRNVFRERFINAFLP